MNAPAQQTMRRISRIAYAPDDCLVFSGASLRYGRLPGGAIFSGNTAENEEADAFKFLAWMRNRLPGRIGNFDEKVPTGIDVNYLRFRLQFLLPPMNSKLLSHGS